MDREKRNGVSEEERIKQRNLNWPKRRRIIGRVLFVVLGILGIFILRTWEQIGKIALGKWKNILVNMRGKMCTVQNNLQTDCIL